MKRAAGIFAVLVLAAAPAAASLSDELGLNAVRVYSAPFTIPIGRTVEEVGLLQRLARAGYARVHERPSEPGQFFYGNDVFWIYRRAHRWAGDAHDAELIGLRLERPQGRIVGPMEGKGRAGDEGLRLEPVALAESLDGSRAPRIPVRFAELPEHVWRAVLAAEDARFFEHGGIDARSVARAAIANLKEGRLAQGGSTITQQLVKNRDLSPERSLGRKVSEAVRAMSLEAEYPKEEILEAYLNEIYFGHVGGTELYGIGAAARAYFSKSTAQLTAAEAALIAAVIQAPNRLSPVRHAEAARQRRDWVLGRMEELGWLAPAETLRARSSPVRVDLSEPEREGPVHFLSWVRELTGPAPSAEPGRGVVVETSLDPYLQELAMRATSEGVARLRSRPQLARASVAAALVALDAATGEVLAYVGGPGDDFDRARLARRQPGSTVKPFIVLEALDECGSHEPLHAATRVADEPLRLEGPGEPWEPTNADRLYLEVVDLRRALAGSRNVPLVRVARHCGFEAVARTFERAGLELPDAPPPSFALGSIETSPLELAAAYTVLSTPGRRLEPLPVRRTETPEGARIERYEPRSRRVADPAAAYIVRDMLRTAVEEGTAITVAVPGLEIAAKTGTTTGQRDGWLAGHAGPLVVVVWVGLDDGGPLGLPGAEAAGPIWKAFVRDAGPARAPYAVPRPAAIVEFTVDPDSGLRVREGKSAARTELFRRGDVPRRNRFWRIDRAEPVIR